MQSDIGYLIESMFGDNLSEFSRVSGVPYGTVYGIAKGKAKRDNISVGAFMKIAHALGMTAEELYYGTPPQRPSYSDQRQSELNGHYESLNDDSKSDLVGFAKSFAADPERRIEKDSGERADNQAAMGA